MALNNKPTVLVMTDWYEPGFKAGGPIQSCKNIVNTLKDRFSFSILTSDRDLGDSHGYANIQPDVWLPLSEGVQIMYASPGLPDKQRFLQVLQEVSPDVVYFNSMFSRQFSLQPLAWLRSAKYKGRIVLAPRGMLQEGAMQKKTFKKKLFLNAFRLLGWHKKIVFHATDEQEQRDIEQYFPGSAGVRLAENIPNTDQLAWEERLKIPGRINCIFISRIHPKKNLDFMLQALENVDTSCNLLLDIYGEEDDLIYSMSCRKKAESLGGHVRVTFYGPLPHTEVFKTLKRYHLFVLPTRGENFGHSIFEALSAGLPVLVSDKTPWRGLEQAMVGWDLPLDRQNEFTKVIESVCRMDQVEYNKWSMGAKEYAEQFTANIDFAGRYTALFA
jgi:glycosyltransferase involved in cell wall biosynthesis